MTHYKQKAKTFNSIMTSGISAAFFNVILCNLFAWIYSATSGFAMPTVINVTNLTAAAIAIALIFSLTYFIVVNVFSSIPGLYYILVGISHAILILLILNFTFENGNSLPQKLTFLLSGFVVISGFISTILLPWLTSASYIGTIKPPDEENYKF